MRRHLSRHVLPVSLLASAALAASGCASVPDGSVEAAAEQCPPESECYDPPRSVGDGGMFTIEAGDFFFSEPQGVYWSGDIHVELVNVSRSEHNIEIVGGGNAGSDERIQVLGDQVGEGVFNLFPGVYTYFCSIPGHRGQGMEGQIEIFPDAGTATAELGVDDSEGEEPPASDAESTPTETETETTESTPSESETASS